MKKNDLRWLVVLITFLAAFLRVYRLSDFPPALYFDEAFDGLDALRVLQTGAFPIFFAGNGGREPLTIYLQSLGMAVWGSSEWGLRLVSAFIGIVTIPIAYRAARAMFGEDDPANAIGVLVAAMLAVLYWHLSLSRLALRVIALPLFSALTMWFFARAWHSQRTRDFILCGAILGLSLYTYLAARALPFVLIAFVILFFLIKRRVSWVGIAAMGIAMLMVIAPLGFYFAQNPSALWSRVASISISGGETAGERDWTTNIVNTVRMLIDRGDLNGRHNLSGRPALDLIPAIGFWIGLVIALVRWRRQPMYALALIWFASALVPTMLSIEAPHFLRASGALVPMTILAADGLLWLREKFVPRFAPMALAALMICFSGALTVHDYFDVWGPAPETYAKFDGEQRTIAERATQT